MGNAGRMRTSVSGHHQGSLPRRAANIVAVTLLALAAALSMATAAQAVTLEAEDVLPPGQSGFVSNAGLASGEGSPHLDDQVSLFRNFDYKPHSFLQPGTTEIPEPGVRIVRDNFGVPAVYGTTDPKAWFGVGYAIAQDRLFELELFKRATSGRLAEILGPSFLPDDIVARRDYYTDPEIDAQLSNVGPVITARINAYRDGINAWIDEVQKDPVNKLPGEYTALGVPLTDWTVRDTGRIGVFLARTVPSGDGMELENAHALKAMGSDYFTLHPLRNKGRRTTIPRSEGEFPSQPGRTRADERRGVSNSVEFLNGLDLPSVEIPPARNDNREMSQEAEMSRASAARSARKAERSDSESAGLRAARERLSKIDSVIGDKRGSFMWAMRDRTRPKRKRTYLYNGPQLGFSIPELFVEFEVHSPRTEARGVSAPGVPLMAIGHNGHVTWGFTSGLSDEDDLYVEDLAGAERYRFRGAERQMSCRDETFTFRTPPTDLPDSVGGSGDSSGPPAGARTERICRTLHGPVQRRGSGKAYARRYAIWNREIETITGLTDLTESRSITDVDKAMQKVTWNENVIAADDRGNIGYWHPGLHPLRPKNYDERFPYPGTGEAEWRGLLPRSKTPHVINPKQGWLTNWNNMPSAGWTNGDAPARERMNGPYHRVRLLERYVGRVENDPDYLSSKRIVRRSGTTAQQRPFAESALRRARDAASGQGRSTLDALLRWNGNYHIANSAGTVDPGVAIWEEFKDQLEARMLRRLPKEARLLVGETSLSHQFDISNGESVALQRESAGSYARAADATAAALTRRYGTSDIRRWRERRRLYPVAAQGAGAVPKLPFFDRGTWEQSVAMGSCSDIPRGDDEFDAPPC
ncbi:MAG: penicillin acylase family protein [Solirubrobacterales bacterium]